MKTSSSIIHRIGLALAFSIAVWTTMACAGAHHASGGRPEYVIISLGTLPSGENSAARAVNDFGHIVGSASTAQGTTRPFLYRHGKMREIPVPPEFRSSGAYAINNSSLILGCYEDSPDIDDEILFIHKDGVTVPLTALTGDPTFSASALNDTGHIAGAVSIPGMQRNEAAVFRDGIIVSVAAPAGNLGSQAQAINSRSVIAGEAVVVRNGIGSQMAFLSFDGVAWPLSPLGQHSLVNDINDRNEVVGFSYFPTNSSGSAGPHAALYLGGTVIDLGTLGGLEYSEARAINNHGVIVGYASGSGISRAFIYRAGRMIDLNTLIRRNSGWVLEQAYDINNRGQIVGSGTYRGRYRAFLLSPLTRTAKSLPGDRK